MFEYFFENWTSISLSTKQQPINIGSITFDPWRSIWPQVAEENSGVSGARGLVSMASPDELLSDAKHQKTQHRNAGKGSFMLLDRKKQLWVSFFLIPRPNQGLHR